MTDFIKFPKIRQFRDIIKQVRNKTDFQGLDENGAAIFEHKEPYPTLRYKGTVKIHGTNASFIIETDGSVIPQSRSRQISVESDNAGFAAFVHGLPKELISSFCQSRIVVFGEWAGKGIQKGVAVSQLDRLFVIFAIKHIDSGKWMNLNEYSFPTELLNKSRVFVITQFPSNEIEIDFNKPELAQEKLIEITNDVEKECPIGKYFDVSDTGEGVVWVPQDAELFEESGYWMKVKGEKHSVSKVKTLAPVDIEQVNNVREFVEMSVTPQRLEQGIQVMKEKGVSIERKNTGDYLRWVVSDILSEELDTLTGNGLCTKDVSGNISSAARPYWFSQCDANY